MIIKTLSVKVYKGHILECELSDGTSYHYDMSDILSDNSEMIKPLQEHQFFSKVYLEFGHLAWPNGFDIHTDTIIRDGKLISKKAS